jgi:hypothetical protein
MEDKLRCRKKLSNSKGLWRMSHCHSILTHLLQRAAQIEIPSHVPLESSVRLWFTVTFVSDSCGGERRRWHACVCVRDSIKDAALRLGVAQAWVCRARWGGSGLRVSGRHGWFQTKGLAHNGTGGGERLNKKMPSYGAGRVVKAKWNPIKLPPTKTPLKASFSNAAAAAVAAALQWSYMSVTYTWVLKLLP